MLKSSELDSALITSLVNVRYLSGFTGSNAALLVSASGADLLATDGRYTEQAAEEAPGVSALIARACAPRCLSKRASTGVGQLRAHHVTVTDHEAWSGIEGLTLSQLGAAVEELRRTKDAHEIALLTEACAVGDRALEALLPTLAVGQTERQYRRLEAFMLDLGGDALSFDTIVATDPTPSIRTTSPQRVR